MILTLSNNEHPAIIDIFSDSMSWLHLGWGLLAGMQDPVSMMSMVVMYMGYQVTQAQSNEPWERTGGEFVELGLGLAIASFMRKR
jgi:hypothetical protein